MNFTNIRRNSIDFTILPGQITREQPYPVPFHTTFHKNIIKTQPLKANLSNDIVWMDKPNNVKLECLEDLEYLISLNGLSIHQELPLSTGENRYVIKNMLGQHIYHIDESFYENMRTDYGHGYGPGYVMRLLDRNNKEVLRFNRKMKNLACCWCATKNCEMCSNFIIVEASGQKIGYVRQNSSCWKPYLTILDENKKKNYRVRGPCCFSESTIFDIYTVSYGSYVGKIFINNNVENKNTMDHFQITFPENVDVKQKAMFLAALLLIDSIYFESQIVEQEQKK